MIDWTKCKLVPVEPTPEMCKAVSDYGSTRYIYAEMLAAAPQPPVVEVTMAQAEEITRIMDSKPMRMTRDSELCQILAASFRGDAKEWIEHDDGRTECTAFVPLGAAQPQRDDRTMDMFGDPQ